MDEVEQITFINTFFITWINSSRRAVEMIIDAPFAHFPNLYAVANQIFVAFQTISLAPIRASLEAMMASTTQNARWYRRKVVTGEQVVRIVQNTIREGFLEATFLKENTIADALMQWLLVSIWNGTSRVRFLWKAANVNGLDDLIKLYQNSTLKTIYIRLFTLFWGFMSLGVLTIAYVSFAANFHKLFDPLAQDSVRVWKKRPGRHRVNKKGGADT